MSMPGEMAFGDTTSYYGATLLAYIQNGSIPLSTLDTMCTRIFASFYFLRQDSPTYPRTNFDAFRLGDDSVNERIDVRGDDHAKLAREMAAASHVLLKNVRGALPLRRGKGQGKRGTSMVLIGSDAGPGRAGPNEFPDQGGVDGIVAMGWGSGCVL
jgi:beta-glucosidase-like glycosyl hydrolase